MSETYLTQHCMTHDIPAMLRRMQVRLRLAEFKRKNGYEKYDLYTLEKNLLRVSKCYHALLRPLPPPTTKSHRHRYYPTFPVNKKYKTTRSMLLLATHVQGPLSAKRDTPPRRMKEHAILKSPSPPSSSDDEDAAKLLVMLHHNTKSHSFH
ncbi:hypothetical protein K492DRAFT_207059 [Lichtheimia hyalospora FSU 10163]|nr:hypothetical protein K492DRAFT_207059 [Lichtheimia hyalospora FSU 10163]